MSKFRKDAVFIDTRMPRARPTIRRARVIPVPGQPIEAYQYERLIKCWYCGDVNTTGRDEGKSGHTRMSSSYSMPRQESLGAKGYDSNEGISVAKTVLRTRVAPIAGADGTARPVKNVWAVIAHIGCKACGTLLED